MIRLARVSYSIIHVPVKLLCTADTLSQAPRAAVDNDTELEEDTEYLMEIMINNLPSTKKR